MEKRKKIFEKRISHFTKLAYEQAKINLGSTGQNPSVGCIIEKNGSVISSGRTSLNGRPHAEYNALNKEINFKDSKMYITMEPCTHFGKTPPCTNKIIQKKIKKVFFSSFDADIRTSYKAKKILSKNKIFVRENVLDKLARTFYKSYFLSKQKSLPLIDAKIAISNDYKTVNKKSKWITNNHSRKRVHLLRSKYDCILSTSKSINKDNSLLDCRIQGLEGKSPDIFILDRNLKIKNNVSILKNIKKRKIYIITSKINKLRFSFFKKKKY